MLAPAGIESCRWRFHPGDFGRVRVIIPEQTAAFMRRGKDDFLLERPSQTAVFREMRVLSPITNPDTRSSLKFPEGTRALLFAGVATDFGASEATIFWKRRSQEPLMGRGDQSRPQRGHHFLETRTATERIPVWIEAEIAVGIFDSISNCLSARSRSPVHA